MNGSMALTRQRVAADAGFWPAAARAVIGFACEHGAADGQLQALTWVVPSGPLAQCARAALHEVGGRRAFIPPRMVPLSAWAGELSSTGVEARLEIFYALRSNDWIARNFGAQPATLWSLASDVARLCDELTLAAVDNAEALDQRLQDSLARHYGQRASRALQAPAQLVLRLWRARRSADDGAARAIAQLASRATALDCPLVYLSGSLALPNAPPCEGWELAFLERAAARVPVLHLVGDIALALPEAPLLAAAWPELVRAEPSEPIAARADRIRGREGERPLTLVCGASLEETADTVARQVLLWLEEGRAPIALVALDRLIARRVRALLERAQVMVRDETGWKLSTTSAAASIMRWFDLVVDDLYWRDLLDWMKSSFTLADRPAKAEETAVIERAIRSRGVVQGLRAIREALQDRTPPDGADAAAHDAAMGLLQQIEAEVLATRRAPAALHAHLLALRHAMVALGMQAGLEADPVGRAVLMELDRLGSQLAAHKGSATLADFRALLTQRFEDTAFVDPGIESPVVMVPLAAAALRHFDAAVLIGADGEHLPPMASELLFLSNAVRAELGLATAETIGLQAAAQLASVLTATPCVVAAWRSRVGEEANPVSPLLERLQFVCVRARGDDLVEAQRALDYDVEPVPAATPQPSAPQLLPLRISASAAQSLVNCPYQFYARCMLGLDEPEDVIELPDKRDFGIALHEVLKRFHRAWGEADFSAVAAAELTASLREHAERVFAPQFGRMPGLLAYQRRFDGLVGAYIDWLQRHAAEGWRWSAGEQSYGLDVPLRQGRVELVGRVDRVDAHADGRRVLIDYKARAANSLRRGLTRSGEDIQLPFYGLLLPRPADAAHYLSFERARNGEGGVSAVAPEEPLDALVAAVGTRLRSDLQRIADGAVLPAIGGDEACRYCEMRGLCRRDHWGAIEDSGDSVS